MDAKLLALYEHKDLLESLGYELDKSMLDLLQKEDKFYKRANITYNGERVGNLGLEEQNMYHMNEDGKIVGNKDISLIKYSTRKQKNYRTLVHTYINHGSLYINCFNMLHSIGRTDSEDRNYICLTDFRKIKIVKYLDIDEIEVKSITEDYNDDTVLEGLRTKKRPKELSYKLGVVMDEHKD